MVETHLTQHRFTYSACDPLTKDKAIGDSKHISRNELDKACFKHDTPWDFKDLPRRTAFYKVLRDKAFEITSSPK